MVSDAIIFFANAYKYQRQFYKVRVTLTIDAYLEDQDSFVGGFIITPVCLILAIRRCLADSLGGTGKAEKSTAIQVSIYSLTTPKRPSQTRIKLPNTS